MSALCLGSRRKVGGLKTDSSYNTLTKGKPPFKDGEVAVIPPILIFLCLSKLITKY